MVSLPYKWLLFSFLPASFLSTGQKAFYSGNQLPHPFYISVTQINHNAKDKTVEISCKMFADDFEQILEKNYKAQLDIASVKDKSTFDKIIPDYISKHLGIAIDSKPAKISYVGYEKEKESVFCYLEINNIVSIKRMDIVNSLLHDFNDTQINIMHVTVNGKRQSTKLDYPNKEASFVF
jgi:hypothetical protein